jgi:hypothetical protein
MVPGWPYSVIVALETCRSSWTAPLDAVRLAPGADAATVTAAQVRDVVNRLTTAGHWQPGDPDILLVADAGYDGPRLAHVLADLPVTVLVRMRADRVLRRPTPPQPPGTLGRPAGTAASSPLATRARGASLTAPPTPRPVFTAPP